MVAEPGVDSALAAKTAGRAWARHRRARAMECQCAQAAAAWAGQLDGQTPIITITVIRRPIAVERASVLALNLTSKQHHETLAQHHELD